MEESRASAERVANGSTNTVDGENKDKHIDISTDVKPVVFTITEQKQCKTSRNINSTRGLCQKLKRILFSMQAISLYLYGKEVSDKIAKELGGLSQLNIDITSNEIKEDGGLFQHDIALMSNEVKEGCGLSHSDIYNF